MKKDKPKSDSHKDAKMSVLSELRDMAMNMMGEKGDKYSQDPADISKISTEARGPSDKSQGIVLNEQILPGEQGHPGSGLGQGKGMNISADSSLASDGDMNEDFDAEDPMEKSYDDDMSDEDIDSMIAQLQLKKSSRMSKA